MRRRIRPSQLAERLPNAYAWDARWPQDGCAKEDGYDALKRNFAEGRAVGNHGVANADNPGPGAAGSRSDLVRSVGRRSAYPGKGNGNQAAAQNDYGYGSGCAPEDQESDSGEGPDQELGPLRAHTGDGHCSRAPLSRVFNQSMKYLTIRLCSDLRSHLDTQPVGNQERCGRSLPVLVDAQNSFAAELVRIAACRIRCWSHCFLTANQLCQSLTPPGITA